MFISEAFAQGIEAATIMPEGPSPFLNIGMMVVMVGLFYLLLIRPQQKRFKEHGNMLSAIKKGDNVVTGGGLVGVVEKEVGDDQLLVNLGGGVSVTAMRSTLTGKAPEGAKVVAANDKPKKASVKKAAAKKVPAKKKAPAKKTATKKAAPKKRAAKKS